MGVDAELEKPEVGLKRTLKDLFSGAVGGVAQVLLGESTIELALGFALNTNTRHCKY
jgi:hypothetical protein